MNANRLIDYQYWLKELDTFAGLLSAIIQTPRTTRVLNINGRYVLERA